MGQEHHYDTSLAGHRAASMKFTPPRPGDHFVVADHPGLMTVDVCHIGVSEHGGSVRYLVRAVDGSHWLLIARRADDELAQWIGAPALCPNSLR